MARVEEQGGELDDVRVDRDGRGDSAQVSGAGESLPGLWLRLRAGAGERGEAVELAECPAELGAEVVAPGLIGALVGAVHCFGLVLAPHPVVVALGAEQFGKLRRNGARWAVALALGLRQGEALGLKWDRVALDKGTIRIRRSRLRPKYAHGCGGTCGRKAGLCPQRAPTREPTGDVKSKAGRRTIGLPPQLVALLRARRAEQERERAIARQLWRDEGWVFTTPDGEPINPRTDSNEWKRLLKDAGLREARLHDARHTAATVLLVLRQPTPTVMSLMGWSSESMAVRYQHVTDTLRSQVASQVGDLIWDTPSSTGTSDQDLLTVRRGPLAVLLAVVQECIADHRSGNRAGADMLAAIAELSAALPTAAAPPDNSNETETETRRPSAR